MRKTLLLALALALALPAAAQETRPPNLEPIPEPPPPPPGLELDPSLEPQVTIRQQGEDKVEEFRIRGRLYMVKVTPPHGVPYYLIDQRGDGVMTRQEPMDSGLRVPMWVIQEF